MPTSKTFLRLSPILVAAAAFGLRPSVAVAKPTYRSTLHHGRVRFIWSEGVRP